MASEPAVAISGALRRLRLFNKKAEELSQLSFAGQAFHETAGVMLRLEGDKTRIQKRGADREATAALVLTLRLFLQPRDGIKLEQIETLYQTLPVPDEDKHWVSENVRGLNSFLDAPGDIEIAVNGTPLTRRLILETFL